MSFLVVLSFILALTVMAYLWAYAFLHRGRPGSLSLLMLISVLCEWMLSLFVESLSPPELKIWCRDAAQIGLYGIPAALWAFTVAYTQRNGSIRQWESATVVVLGALGAIACLLTITDGWHHWVRDEVRLVSDSTGVELVVRNSRLGEAMRSLIYLAAGASFLRLGLFALKDGRSQRLPFALFLLAILVPAAYGLYLELLPATPGVRPPLPLALSVSALILAFGAYRFDFLGVTPIARNLVFDVLEEGIVVCSTDGRVVDLNAAARHLLLPEGGDFSEAERVLDQGFPARRERANEMCEAEFPLQGAEGLRIVHLVNYPVARSGGFVLGHVSVLRDVTQLRRQNAILVDKAERDGLTGLLNRATFVDRVEQLLVTPVDQPTLLLFDIDEFKSINDRFGHMGGDRTLQHVVTRVGASLRETDVFGRLGGDEFAVFLTGLDPVKLAALAERIRAGVAESKLMFEDKKIDVAISVGFARNLRSFEQLYHKADQALYEAKRQGRNLVRGE